MPENSETPTISPLVESQKSERNGKKILLILLVALFLVSLVGVGLWLLIPGLTEEPSSPSSKQATPSVTKKKPQPEYKPGLYFSKDSSIYQADYNGKNQKLVFQNASEKDTFVYHLAFSATGKYLTWTSRLSKDSGVRNFSRIFYYTDADKKIRSNSYGGNLSRCNKYNLLYDLSSDQDEIYLYDKGLQKLTLESGESTILNSAELSEFHLSLDGSKILDMFFCQGSTAKAKVLNIDGSREHEIDFTLYSSDGAWIDNNRILAVNESNRATVKIVPADGTGGELIPIDTSYEQAVQPRYHHAAKNHISADRKSLLILTHLYGKVTGGNVYKYDLGSKKLVKLAPLKGFEKQIKDYGWLPNGRVWFTIARADPSKTYVDTNKFYDLWILSADGKSRTKILTEITTHAFN
jgi:hypothetical protein